MICEEWPYAQRLALALREPWNGSAAGRESPVLEASVQESARTKEPGKTADYSDDTYRVVFSCSVFTLEIIHKGLIS